MRQPPGYVLHEGGCTGLHPGEPSEPGGQGAMDGPVDGMLQPG